SVALAGIWAWARELDSAQPRAAKPATRALVGTNRALGVGTNLDINNSDRLEWFDTVAAHEQGACRAAGYSAAFASVASFGPILRGPRDRRPRGAAMFRRLEATLWARANSRWPQAETLGKSLGQGD